jgi:hypothetical protein
LVLAVAAVITFIAVALLFERLVRQASSQPRSPFSSITVVPPEPRLQVAPAEDLRALRAREEEVLRTYGWVNREKGVVRIPIERAMELLVERERTK